MKVAHLYWDHAPHLVRRMAAFYSMQVIPGGCVFLRDTGCIDSRCEAESKNADWIIGLPKGVYRGYLRQAWWMRSRWLQRIFISKIFSMIMPEFSFWSLIKLILGPRSVLLHGSFLFPGTMFFLKCFGKRIALIHWGGQPALRNRKSGIIDLISYKLMRHIFVLMLPEVPAFCEIVGTNRVSCLPYIDLECTAPVSRSVDYSHKTILVGNSAWQLDGYKALLDKFPTDSWQQIVCMLNYGRENEVARVDSFVKEQKNRFGATFFAWRQTLPYKDYIKAVECTPYYICPSRHQTGLGAIYLGVLLGKTIFLRGDNYVWMRELGVKTVDIDSLASFSWEEMSKSRLTDEEISDNRNALKNFFEANNAQWATEVKKGFA